jgi:hypothetical protein
MWIDFLNRLHAGTESEARTTMLHMSSADVLAFWRWNDRETALEIDLCPADEVADMIDGLRSQLWSDVLSEIAYRARSKAGV